MMKRFFSIMIYIILWIAYNNFSSVSAQNSQSLDSLVVKKDSISKKKYTMNGYPYVFYTPETELAAGAGGIIIFYTDSDSIVKPSKIGFGGYYSTLKQYKISLNPALYYFENKLFIKLPLSFGSFVDKFWGIGNESVETGVESYKKTVFSASLFVQSPPIFFSADRSGLIIDYNNTEIIDKKENEFLLNDSVIGSNGGKILGIGYDLTWDNRDHIFFPNSGGYQYFKFLIYPSGLSDFSFTQLDIEIKQFWSFKPDHVIAGNLYIASSSGDVPFYKLPALGGPSIMRGYFQGRYRDKFYAAMQLEYRQYFSKKFGYVVFGSMGDVANKIIKYNINEMKYSYGVGLRYLFNKKQKINLRMDIGIGQDGNTGIYFGIEEAF